MSTSDLRMHLHKCGYTRELVYAYTMQAHTLTDAHTIVKSNRM